MKNYVLYHGGCVDGFTAAWALEKWLVNVVDTKVEREYIGMGYRDPMPEIPDRAQVYMLDFTLPKVDMERLMARGCQLYVYDHHVTRKEWLLEMDSARCHVVFDENKCGARLVWEDLFNQDAPDFIEYVEDRDLWRWKWQDSKEVNAAIRSYPFDFDTWDELHLTFCHAPRLVILTEEGRAILRREQYLVDAVLERVSWGKVAGHRVPFVNSAFLQSEIGEALCEKFDVPFGVVYADFSEHRKWDLRSRPRAGKPTFHVGNLATRFGGGGHEQSAGFETPLPNWICDGTESSIDFVNAFYHDED